MRKHLQASRINNRKLSVKADISRAAKNRKASPTRETKFIQPWIDLANLQEKAGPLANRHPARLLQFEAELRALLVRHRAAKRFPAARIETWVARQEYGILRVYELASNVRNSFVQALKGRGATRLPLLLGGFFLAAPVFVAVSLDDKGKFTVESDDLFRDQFVPIFCDLEPRISRCGYCATFFYAVRKDKKACSKRHGAILRTQTWQKNSPKYAQARKLKS
jgi:hypothetical protein